MIEFFDYGMSRKSDCIGESVYHVINDAMRDIYFVSDEEPDEDEVRFWLRRQYGNDLINKYEGIERMPVYDEKYALARYAFCGNVIDDEQVFNTREEAFSALAELGEFAGLKSAWLAEANCGQRIPNDLKYEITVQCYEDGEYIGDGDTFVEIKYGIHELLEEYGFDKSDAYGKSYRELKAMGLPFGIGLKEMLGRGW